MGPGTYSRAASNYETPPSYCANYVFARIVVRESTDQGQSWSDPQVVAELDPNNSSARCSVIDGSAYYDGGSDTWHMLAQCAGTNDTSNICHFTRAGTSALGSFTADANNPVVSTGELWSSLCSAYCPSNTKSEGTPEIMYKDGGLLLCFLSRAWFRLGHSESAVLPRRRSHARFQQLFCHGRRSAGLSHFRSERLSRLAVRVHRRRAS